MFTVCAILTVATQKIMTIKALHEPRGFDKKEKTKLLLMTRKLTNVPFRCCSQFSSLGSNCKRLPLPPLLLTEHSYIQSLQNKSFQPEHRHLIRKREEGRDQMSINTRTCSIQNTSYGGDQSCQSFQQGKQNTITFCVSDRDYLINLCSDNCYILKYSYTCQAAIK